MEEVITPPAVPGTVHCAVCRARYEPTPDQTLVLAGLGPITGWKTVATQYATDAGWYERTDGLLLCATHLSHGDRPVSLPAT